MNKTQAHQRSVRGEFDLERKLRNHEDTVACSFCCDKDICNMGGCGANGNFLKSFSWYPPTVVQNFLFSFCFF